MQKLKDRYKDYFKIGAAVNSRTIKSHADLITTHFNSITCGNEMKFISVAPEEGKYTFNRADEIYDFAVQNNIALRGHTFVWHNQTPDWVFDVKDRDQLLDRLRKHIATVGGRYKDQVYCWDAVNEAIEDKSDVVLRQTKWLAMLGENYLDDVFRIAKEMLPETELFYNDYNETNHEKRMKIYQTVKGMKERGVPVNGIGMQMHINIYGPSIDDLKRALELYSSLNVRIQVTEMDVSLFAHNDHTKLDNPSAELIERQAQVYADCFKVFREYKDYIDCVTLWGVADDSTWLDNFPVRGRKNWPLLFDVNHNPKEAFYRILEF
jgi:endo-1,4-beta-xylanase